MSSFDAGKVGEIRVWTMTPVGVAGTSDQFTFPWNWGNWVENKRLIANSDTLQPGGMGHADFTLLRETISDNQANLNGRPFTLDNVSFPVVPGQYIMITVGPLNEVRPNGGPIDLLTVNWWGFIDEVDGEQIAGTSEIIGSVKALGVGHLLDRMTARGWKRADSSGHPQDIISPESANMGGPLDGTIVGNAYLTADDGSSRSAFLFQNDPSKCDSTAIRIWTKWRLLNHFQTYGLNDEELLAGVRWNVFCYDFSQGVDPSGTTIAGYMNSTAVPETFLLRNQSCKGIIDILIPRAHGLGWTIGLGDLGEGVIGWSILIYSLTDGTDYGLPTFDVYKQDVDLAEIPTVRLDINKSSVDVPDEIVVEGNQIIFGVTASYVDGNIQAGWDQTAVTGQEQLYRDAAKNGTGYSALTRADQLDRNRSMRQSPLLVDVFTRFNLKPFFGGAGTTNGDLLRAPLLPGQDSASKPMCPQVGWDGASILIYEDSTRCPYLPTANLARTLPWIEGFTALGVDSRPVNMRAWPSFAKPRLFYYDKTKALGSQWTDLTARGGSRATPSFDVDDRGVSLRVQYDMSERFGKNTIDLAADAVYDLGETTATPVEGFDIFDWKKCAFTFGVPSDQRVQFSVRRPGVADASQIRYSMKITDEKLNCWIMHGGTILSIDANGYPTRINGTGPGQSVIVRNDFARAQSKANQLAAFYFRSRQGFTYTGMRPDQPPAFAYIGAAVGTITETAADAAAGISAVSGDYNTVVELVTHTYGMTPRVTISADLPQAPTIGGSASNPAGGGPISLSLNGTVSQATQQMRQDVSALQDDGKKTPLVAAYSPRPSAITYLYTIQGGNALAYLSAQGIVRRSDAVTTSELPLSTGGNPGDIVTVPAFPIPTGLPDGVGVAKSVNSSEYIFILCDSTTSAFTPDLVQNELVQVLDSTNLDKISGGITYRYVCWRIVPGWWQ